MILTPRNAGYATIMSHEGVIEYDTITCGHCGNVKPVRTNNPNGSVDLGGHCRICDHDICSGCCDIASTEGCVPFRKKLDEWAAHYRLRTQIEELSRAG